MHLVGIDVPSHLFVRILIGRVFILVDKGLSITPVFRNNTYLEQSVTADCVCLSTRPCTHGLLKHKERLESHEISALLVDLDDCFMLEISHKVLKVA